MQQLYNLQCHLKANKAPDTVIIYPVEEDQLLNASTEISKLQTCRSSIAESTAILDLQVCNFVNENHLKVKILLGF